MTDRFDQGFEQLSVLSYPVQLIELDEGVLLRRADIRLFIAGEHALSSIAIIISLCSSQSCLIAEILKAFPPSRKSEIVDLLKSLIAKRLLIIADDKEDNLLMDESNEDIFFWQFDRQPKEVHNHTNKMKVDLIGLNALSMSLREVLQRTGLKHENINLVTYESLTQSEYKDDHFEYLEFDKWLDEVQRDAKRIILACAPFGAQELLLPINKICCDHHIPFLPVIIENTIIKIGPLVRPGETACLECLRTREDGHLSNVYIERVHEQYYEQSQMIMSQHGLIVDICANIVGLEIIKIGMGLALGSELLEYDCITNESIRRWVLANPFCNVCASLFPDPRSNTDGIQQ